MKDNDLHACPVCEEGYRYFYTLTTDDIILMCEECSAVWLRPEAIKYKHAVSDNKLKNVFNVTNPQYLFTDHNNTVGWSSAKDVKQSIWKTFAKNNANMIFPKHHGLNEQIRYPYSYLF